MRTCTRITEPFCRPPTERQSPRCRACEKPDPELSRLKFPHSFFPPVTCCSSSMVLRQAGNRNTWGATLSASADDFVSAFALHGSRKDEVRIVYTLARRGSHVVLDSAARLERR